MELVHQVARMNLSNVIFCHQVTFYPLPSIMTINPGAVPGQAPGRKQPPTHFSIVKNANIMKRTRHAPVVSALLVPEILGLCLSLPLSIHGAAPAIGSTVSWGSNKVYIIWSNFILLVISLSITCQLILLSFCSEMFLDVFAPFHTTQPLTPSHST